MIIHHRCKICKEIVSGNKFFVRTMIRDKLNFREEGYTCCKETFIYDRRFIREKQMKYDYVLNLLSVNIEFKKQILKKHKELYDSHDMEKTERKAMEAVSNETDRQLKQMQEVCKMLIREE